MKINEHAELLKIGDKVTTDFNPGDKSIVRVIDKIRPNTECSSGRSAIASALKKCGACGMSHHTTPDIDSSWFVPVEDDRV